MRTRAQLRDIAWRIIKDHVEVDGIEFLSIAEFDDPQLTHEECVLVDEMIQHATLGSIIWGDATREEDE